MHKGPAVSTPGPLLFWLRVTGVMFNAVQSPGKLS